MKSIFFALLASPVFFVSGLFGQVASNCTVAPNLREFYQRDVANCAVQQMFENGSADTLLVKIPAGWTDPIWGGLAAIYNATSIPERDSVFDLYCVHDNNWQRQNYSSFLVQVDTSYAWTQAWQNNTTLTGQPLMDLILTKYDVHLANFYNWSIGTYAELSTDSIWNDYALMDSLRQVPGVIFAEQNMIIGAAGMIIYENTLNGHRFDFYLEFNDCFDGCDNYRKWKFLVSPNCDVTYLGFDDWWTFNHDPLPAPTYCNISNSLPEPVGGNFEIFPNPTNGDIRLDFSDPLASYAMTITDMTGRVVKRRDLVYSREEIYLGSLPEGAYVVTLLGVDGKRISRRLVKH